MDFILSGWYLLRKKPIVSIKYITQNETHTLSGSNEVLKFYTHLIRAEMEVGRGWAPPTQEF
jgi:hypothetical protein